MKGLDIVRLYGNLGSGRTIAIVLGEMKHNRAARDLGIRREAGIKLMFPIELESEPLQIKRFRDGGIDYSKNRNRWLERHVGPDSVAQRNQVNGAPP